MSTVELPSYTPSDRAPAYRSEPRGDEQRLAVTPRASAPRRPPIASSSSVPGPRFRNTTSDISFTLDRDAPIVIDETVSGQVSVLDLGNVKAVYLVVEGEQQVRVSSPLKHLRKEVILSFGELELWRSPSRLRRYPTHVNFTFSVPFPSTFQDAKSDSSTPPSFSGKYPGTPTISAYLSYSLRVVASFYDESKRIYSDPQAVFYRPQSTPPLPTPPNGPPFLSITKLTPEAWCQVTTSVPSRKCAVKAIDCHLFMPTGLTYALGRPIPFQLQLRAPMSHLLALQGVMPMNGNSIFTTGSAFTSAHTARSFLHNTSGSRRSLSMLALPQRKIEPANEGSLVRVYLQRQLTSKISAEDISQTIDIGEAELTSMTAPDGEDVLVWEGRVECISSPNVITSGFSTNVFEVKDFIVIHIRPSRPDVSPWREHVYSHPIHLVTDPYEEGWH